MTNQVEVFQPQDSQPAPIVANQPVDMLQYAIQKDAAIDVIERLMALQEQTRQREAKAAFDRAISIAKSEIPVILKTQSVAFGDTKYKYEDLGQIATIVDPILSQHGLSYRFRTESDIKDKAIKVTCVVSHQLGYSEENSLTAANDSTGGKNAIQAIGSAQTYLQRYTLKAALGLASAKDDDARFQENKMETITEIQVNRINELISKTNSDIDQLCRAQKVQSVPEIAAKDFKSVERLLLMKFERGAK